MTNSITPDDTLRALELEARTLEQQHVGGTLDLRTVTYVVDKEPWAGAGYQARVRLLVQAKYGAFSEQMAGYGKQEVAARYPRVHLEYVCFWESHTVPLKRQEALFLLTTGNIPFRLQEKSPLMDDDDFDPGEFIRSGAAKRNSGLERGSVKVRTFMGNQL